jgi:hypothetical protein
MKKVVVTFFLGCAFGGLAAYGVVRFGGPGTPPEPTGPLAATDADGAEGDGRAADPTAGAATEASAPVELAAQDPPAADPEEYPYGIPGRVVDIDGNPIPAADVFARAGNIERITLSDEDGQFEITNVPLGMYEVEASASGYGRRTRYGIAPEGPPIELVLEQGADLVGRVLRDGEGVAGVAVLAAGPGLFPPVSVTTEAGGRFVLTDLARAGRVELLALGDGAGSGFSGALALGEGEPLALELRPSVPLEVRVTDGQTGAPIETGVLSLSRESLSLLNVNTPVSQGSASLTGLPEGPVYLRVRAQGYLPWELGVHHDGAVVEARLEPGQVPYLENAGLDPSTGFRLE